MIMPMIGFLASKGHNIMIKIFNPKKVKNTLSFIKNNIGLRLQSRLTKEQAKFVARCNSIHRDISLNF